MIAKGTTHNNGAKLAEYMIKEKAGERVALWQLRGFEATDIKDAFRDVQIMAGATKCEQPFFHVQVRNREGENLTRQQWEYAADRIERMLGLTGQPRAISFHTYEHNNDEHMHVAWSRIDQDTMTARPLPFFKERLKKLSRELELHFGLEPVANRREGPVKYAPTRGEDEQARRLGMDIHEARNVIRQCFDRSDCGLSFRAALEQEGYVLAQGERRDYVAIDRAGGMHALGKRILDVSAAKLRDRFSDLDRDQLPGVAMAKALVEEARRLKEAQKENTDVFIDRDADDRAWQDAVVNAAIESEKAQRQFVEKMDREDGRQKGRHGADSRKRDEAVLKERPLDPTSAQIRLAYGLSQSPESFRKMLDEAGYRLACVTPQEAYRSHREAAFARETGRFANDYRDGEFVVLTERGRIYRLNDRTTGESRNQIDAFMSSLDRALLKGIDATQKDIAENKRPANARALMPEIPVIQGRGLPLEPVTEPLTAWQKFSYAAQEIQQRYNAPDHVRGVRSEIITAFMRSDNAKSFVSAIEGRNFIVAVVSKEDATNNAIDRHYATNVKSSSHPKLREGDFVAVAENGRVHNLNYVTTGQSVDRVQTFMGSLDRKQFPGVGETVARIEARAAQREIERQAFRDLSEGKLKREIDGKPTGRLGRKMRLPINDNFKPIVTLAKKAPGALGKVFDVAGDAFGSLFSPVLTPEQKRESEKSADRWEAEAERTIDFLKYTSDLAQQRMRDDQDREAGKQRERDGRDR